jgi:uncharacterized protein
MHSHAFLLNIKYYVIFYNNVNYLFSIKEYIKIIETLVKPKEVCAGIEDINIDKLFNEGYRTLFLDVDNTLLTYSQRNLSLQKINWIEKAKITGFNIYFVSNNSSYKRLKRVSKQVEIPGIYFALKPFDFGVKEIARDRNINLKKSIVIGDQLLTDIIIGNWLRAHTILVDPLDKRVSFIRTLQRELELYLLKKMG